MADIRENLIDILRKTRYEYRRYTSMKEYEKRMAKTEEEFCAVDDSIVGKIPFYADHLIAHGVTVQEWISTDQRMPTEDDATDGYIAVVYVCGDGVKTRTISLVDVVIAHPDLYDYWMPLNLPQPPKGE